MEKVKVTIVGAGIVGLACAAELSRFFTEIIVMEKYPSFGQEGSSRNSEVIHAGIYYPKNSLKARLCVKGKELIYAYCQEHNIAHKRLGKLIVTNEQNEIGRLEELYKNGLENGVNDLKILPQEQIKKMEPYIRAIAAIHSPSSGIFDSHSLMKSLEAESKRRQVTFAYAHELAGVEKQQDGYKVKARDPKGNIFSFVSEIFINAAGLGSEKVARMVGIKNPAYTLKYCKGDYFRVDNNKARFLSHLIYPTPAKESVSLGMHTVIDLAGGLKLGPDAEYVNKIDYTVDETKKEAFYHQAKPMLPFIELEDLAPDMSGIRAKLQGAGETFRDFVINDETEAGFPGFINLIGIDSPGLTSSLAIAEEVKGMLEAGI
ncbi:MAG: NAD(P)/FAD-dependent oxidoreductase [Elusimicrobiota bacterium]